MLFSHWVHQSDFFHYDSGIFLVFFTFFFWYPLSKSKLLDSQKSELLANFDEIGQGKPRITIFPRITMWGSNFLFHIRLRPPPSASVRLRPPPAVYLLSLSTCLYKLVSIHLSLSMTVEALAAGRRPIYLSICLSVYLPIYLSICLSIYLPIYLSARLSVCLSIYPPSSFPSSHHLLSPSQVITFVS